MNRPRRHRSRPLRVGFYVFFPGGGIGRYTHELMGAMGRHAEVDVTVLCSPGFEWKEASEYTSWPGLYDVWHPSKVRRRLWFMRAQVSSPLRALKYAKDVGLDILHFSSVNHLTFPLWKQRLADAGVRMALTVHDVKRQKAMVNRGWEDRQLKEVYRRAEALFVHSEHQAREIQAFAKVDPQRLYIVPHGPYPHGVPSAPRCKIRAALGLPPDRQVALFFGQIRDEKNLDGLLEAWAEAEIDAHLLVAGKASSSHKRMAYYQKLAATLGLEKDITFLNRFIEHTEVPDLFHASDWVALPYTTRFSSQSGVLNVAAYYERPVLVSAAPVLKETIQACDIGVVCASDTPAALAVGIQRMAKRIRNEYVHDFQTYRRQYSWEENVERTLRVYTSLIR